MSLGIETLIIGGLVMGALFWAARSTYRAVKHTGGCSSCGSSSECPLVENPEALNELARQSRTTPRESGHPQTASCGEYVESLEEKKPV